MGSRRHSQKRVQVNAALIVDMVSFSLYSMTEFILHDLTFKVLLNLISG